MTAATPLPPGLRDRVLAAALRARAAGRSVPEPAQIPPAEAFSRAADAFWGLLCALEDDQWRRPALRGLDVQGLVGHLVGVERDLQRALADDPAVADADHVASTQPAALQQAGRRPGETGREWRESVERTLDAARDDDPDRLLSVYGIQLPLGGLLVVRAFELWAHENDIRVAVGLPPSVPDPSTLRLMTDLAVRLLPRGVASLGGAQDPLGLHLVLTGGGGGTWDIAFGEPDPGSGPAPEVAIVVDAVDFCRLVANRVDPADLDLHVSGATEQAARVLAGTAALALD